MSILISLIRDILSSKPSTEEVSALKEWDLALRDQGKLNNVVAASRKEAMKNPRSADALMNLVSALEQDSDEAFECYRKLMSLDPRHYYAKQRSWIHMRGHATGGT